MADLRRRTYSLERAGVDLVVKLLTQRMFGHERRAVG
jgi:hypothetical protein